MRDCAICKHAHRVEIEAALFKVSPDNAELTMPRIASEFEVPEDALKTHALFHTSFNMEPNGDSIVRQIKMREADMLLATAMEQMSTMQAVGKRIRGRLETPDDEDIKFEKLLTKPVVELYTGTSAEVRRTIQSIADINQLLNGPKDDGTCGLAALAAAIHGSRQPAKEEEDS